MVIKSTKHGRVDLRYKERALHCYVSARVTPDILDKIHEAVQEEGWANVSNWLRAKIYAYLADAPKRKESLQKIKESVNTAKSNPFF